MRIIGGKYKGRLIVPPKGLKVRPTTDYARESLFNILTNRYDFETLSVLDLFAGTGAISYEFASRGVPLIELAELNRNNYRFIVRTLREMDFHMIKSFNTDARIYLRKAGRKFDIVFADPPYDLPWLTDIPGMVRDSGVVAPGGILILEHSGKSVFADKEHIIETRSYGSVNFSFFSF